MQIKTAVFAMLVVGVGCSQAQKDLHNQLWQRTPQSPGPQRIGLVPEPSRRFQDLDSSVATRLKPYAACWASTRRLRAVSSAMSNGLSSTATAPAFSARR